MFTILADAATALSGAMTCTIACREWKGQRLYLKINGKDAGYITEADLSGGTGTCQHVTVRGGTVAAILRGE